MIYITGIMIILLIFTNAITDAPNAISTVVGTKVLPFRKAAYVSAIFNLIGIIAMCFINFSVAKNIATIIKFDNGTLGIITILSSIMSVVLFSLIAMKFGIPTSETHGLIAGLTGSAIALESYNNINLEEWNKVLVGLVWSILGTYILSKLINKYIRYFIKKMKNKNIKLCQFCSCCGLSFMHGAQDGLKFIGVLIIYICALKNVNISSNLNPIENIWLIILVAITMSIGVGFGGKKIVENIGENIAKLSNEDALLTDIVTIFSLFIASIIGIPVSTTHSKTVSIISIGNKLNMKAIKEILKAWIVTFPVCGVLAFLISKFLINICNLM